MDKKPKLNSILICDSIITDKSGKHSLIGVFSEIYANKFPVIHSHMVVFVSLLNNMYIGNLKMDVIITDPNDGHLDAKITDFVLDFKKDQAGTNCIFDFNNVLFNKDGHYKILVKLDAKVIAELPILVTFSKNI